MWHTREVPNLSRYSKASVWVGVRLPSSQDSASQLAKTQEIVHTTSKTTAERITTLCAERETARRRRQMPCSPSVDETFDGLEAVECG